MNKFRKDERGSSLVMTIIAATFISLLAVAVISMTVTNIKLKQAQKNRRCDQSGCGECIRYGSQRCI